VFLNSKPLGANSFNKVAMIDSLQCMTNLRMEMYLKVLLTPTYRKRLDDNVERMGEDKWPKMTGNYNSTKRTETLERGSRG
jgi:hypothetical protein